LKRGKKAFIAGGAKKNGQSILSTLAKKRRVIVRRRTRQSSMDSATKVDVQVANQLSAETTRRSFQKILMAKAKHAPKSRRALQTV
jgi:hypothetical protein